MTCSVGPIHLELDLYHITQSRKILGRSCHSVTFAPVRVDKMARDWVYARMLMKGSSELTRWRQ